jgi:superfamily II DNA/RNA helicase
VYGGADGAEKQIKQLRKGADIIIATPGRLIDLGDRGELDVRFLDVLVLDEAGVARMADMGFMPQVEWGSAAHRRTRASDAALLGDARRRRLTGWSRRSLHRPRLSRGPLRFSNGVRRGAPLP